MIDIQTISIVLACASISIAALYYSFTLRYTRMNLKNTLETRQAQLFLNVYNRWNAHDMQTAYGHFRYVLFPQIKEFADYERLLLNERDKGNLGPWLHMNKLMTYFEGLGMLVKRGLIDIELVEDLFANRIIWCWDMIKDFTYIRRSQAGAPKIFDSVEYLYNELKNREKQSATIAS